MPFTQLVQGFTKCPEMCVGLQLGKNKIAEVPCRQPAVCLAALGEVICRLMFKYSSFVALKNEERPCDSHTCENKAAPITQWTRSLHERRLNITSPVGGAAVTR